MRNFALGVVVGGLAIFLGLSARSWAIDFWVGKEPPTYRITVGTSLFLQRQAEDVIVNCVAEPSTL